MHFPLCWEKISNICAVSILKTQSLIWPQKEKCGVTQNLSQAFLLKLLHVYVRDLSGVFTYIPLSFHQTSLSSPHQSWKEPLPELFLGSLTDVLSSKHGVVILNQIFSKGFFYYYYY